MEEVVKSYEARFGLDQPLWKQYLRYLGDMAPLRLRLLDHPLPDAGSRR